MGNEENIAGYSVSQSRSGGSLLDRIHESDKADMEDSGLYLSTNGFYTSALSIKILKTESFHTLKKGAIKF